MGDFNIVRWQNEKSDPTHFDVNAGGEFNKCLEDIGMEDLNTKGSWFTWSNKRSGQDHCCSRLDRALVNNQWQNLFKETEAAVLTPGVSDHSPLVVSLFPYKGGKKPFKFFNFWMNHKNFSSLLTLSWCNPVENGDNPMLLLYNKMRRLKPCLREFNKEFYIDIQNRVMVAREELLSVQSRRAHSSSDPILLDYEKLCLLNFNDLSAAEEAWSKQKSRIKWLELGDK
ncbi:uncharacterized protein LOC131328490 [Rhododendron vialii]|uniref:uncharacterized protein LOC131328490 n=1 Tax=Rhododendron vialii TaxID=182163 RepID=UPI00265FFF3D|nr:uncharacterized protein LOC131328490 [Rhododendron vialii]